MSRITIKEKSDQRESSQQSVNQQGGFRVQRIFAPLAIVLAFSVLGYLLWVTLRNPLETGIHVVRLEILDAAKEAETRLNRAIVRAPLALDDESRELQAARERYQTVSQSLSYTQTGLAGLSPLIDRALADYRSGTGKKLELVEEHREKLRRFRLLFSAMRVGGVSLLSAPPIEAAPGLREDIKRLMFEATQYSIISSAENGAVIDQLSARVAMKASSLTDNNALAALSQLLDTIDGLRFTRDELNAQQDAIAELAVSGQLAQLRDRYESHFSTLQQEADLNRQTLAAYAAALLLAFGLIAWRLRGSFDELDQLNTELQDANVNLEGLVAERTKDLSAALEDIRMQQAQLIQSEKMASLGQMVAGVAHEINTPLGYANSNVQIVRELINGIEESVDEESKSEFDMLLGDAQYGLEQISELVMGLKNFSRVDRSSTELFALNEGIDTSLKICQNQIKDLEIVKEYGDLPDITCAPSQLNQVFLNLINNASQAMNGQGKLTIRTRQKGEEVEISIADNGCGMDEETVAHIFEPFFTTKAVGEGTGLGLSIVFRIIEDHGGRINVLSAPGQGTEFLINLPIRAPEKNSSEAVTEDSIVFSDSAV